MTKERKPRAIIYFKDLFDFVVFSDPNVEVMIAFSGYHGLRHETQHPIPEWLMNDATEVYEAEGVTPPNGFNTQAWVDREVALIATAEEALAEPT
jgi:hypothetical protein